MHRKNSLENQNAKIHGIYSNRLIDKDERVLFRTLLNRSRDLYPEANPLVLEAQTILAIKMFRAIQAENWDAADRLELMVLRLSLQTGSAPERSSGERPPTTCEQVTEFLSRVDDGNDLKGDPTSDE